jgi:hypothetical protein
MDKKRSKSHLFLRVVGSCRRWSSTFREMEIRTIYFSSGIRENMCSDISVHAFTELDLKKRFCIIQSSNEVINSKSL